VLGGQRPSSVGISQPGLRSIVAYALSGCARLRPKSVHKLTVAVLASTRQTVRRGAGVAKARVKVSMSSFLMLLSFPSVILTVILAVILAVILRTSLKAVDSCASGLLWLGSLMVVKFE
jgi:hypothetical protein